ncbi:hypothetical protein [Nonomuraea solani]|nr:hypothetical protein [Nonomuraea solani]
MFRSMYRIRPVGIAARAISLVLLLPWLLANVHGARDRPGNSRARMIADVEVGIEPDILYTAWRTPIFPVGYAAALAGAVAAALAALWDISWGAPFLILFLLFQAGPFAARWLERLNVTAFRSHAEARLGELIDGRIPRPGAATTFVSVGRVSLVFHYASITGWDSPSGPRRVGVRYLEWVDTGIFVPAGPRTAFVPDYVRIEAGADSAPMRAVAGAVALPLGLVGGSLYGRVIGRDSGSVDNVPVYPLLDLDLDEIVVVDISRAGWSRGAFLRSSRKSTD